MQTKQHFLYLAPLVFGACSLLFAPSKALFLEDDSSSCTDGVDNDNNGIFDDQEPNCAPFFPSPKDDDLDGFDEKTGDCDDDNPEINPNAFEVVGDSIDNNCDGQSDEPFLSCDAALDPTLPLSFAQAIGL